MKKTTILLLVLLLFLNLACSSSNIENPFSGDVKDSISDSVHTKTAEDAIQQYLTGITEQNFEKIFQVCAVDEMAENFDLAFQTERIGAFLPLQYHAPSEYDFFIENNKIQLQADLAVQIKMFTYALLTDGIYSDGRTVMMDSEEMSAFILAVDPKKLSGFEVLQIAFADDYIMNQEKYKENTANIAKTYGADEYTEKVVLFSYNEKTYMVGFTLLRYGDNWKISSQTSPTANFAGSGVPVPISIEEFEETYLPE